MPAFPLFLISLAGLLVGLLVGWLLGSRLKSAAAEAAVRELREQLQQREAALAEARHRETALTGAEAAVRARADAEAEAARARIADKDAFFAAQLEEARQTRERALADLREAFKALSADALKASAPDFLQLANAAFAHMQEAAKGDLAKRQEAIAGLLKPLETQLDAYQKRLQQTESSQSTTLGEVRKQLETLTLHSQSLATETERFRSVLKSSQARGQWGEETLRRVVEAAGMSCHCDFEEQVQDGDRKPDMIVRLPGERLIIVDAKVPDLDFISAIETADLEKRTRLLVAHATKLKETIRDLARKNYPAQFTKALDTVVLFLPAESLFSAALEGDHDLIVWAAERRVMLATPASLIALLRAVSLSWQQHEQTENAQAIAAAAQELYTRVSTFTDHFAKIGASLASAGDAFNKAVGSYERRVRPSGESLKQLGFSAVDNTLPDIPPVSTSLRTPPAPRLPEPEP